MLNELIKFLKKPHYIKNSRINWGNFFVLFFVFYMVAVPFSIMSKLTQNYLGYSFTVPKHSGLYLGLMLVIFAPFCEEIIFRLLLKPRRANFIVFSSVVLAMSLFYLFGKRYIMMTGFMAAGLAAVIPATSVSVLRKVQYFVIKHMAFFFYLSVAAFGSVHVFNFEPSDHSLIFAGLILVMPQMVAGLFMGYVRMKHGILYSMLFHFSMNMLALPYFIHNFGMRG